MKIGPTPLKNLPMQIHIFQSFLKVLTDFSKGRIFSVKCEYTVTIKYFKNRWESILNIFYNYKCTQYTEWTLNKIEKLLTGPLRGE